MAECVSLEIHEKKSVECCNKEQKRAFSELSFELASLLSQQLFCKTLANSIFNLFQIESVDRRVCYVGRATKKSVDCYLMLCSSGLIAQAPLIEGTTRPQ